MHYTTKCSGVGSVETMVALAATLFSRKLTFTTHTL